ncbi:hypothetical protein, partial [Polaromonas sp.]|uniref:hypothetical protein n=1 Tax=Polaromonas sp. TaxID=1869339 RepID=UPI0025CDB161
MGLFRVRPFFVTARLVPPAFKQTKGNAHVHRIFPNFGSFPLFQSFAVSLTSWLSLYRYRFGPPRMRIRRVKSRTPAPALREYLACAPVVFSLGKNGFLSIN